MHVPVEAEAEWKEDEVNEKNILKKQVAKGK